MSIRSVKLFWFSKERLQRGSIENFGDVLSKYIVEKVSNKDVVWQNPRELNWLESIFKTTYFAIGSILHFATNTCTIWGSGLIDSTSEAPNANYLAVRGPETARILKDRGFSVPEIYGDPGLLTSKYFPGKLTKKSPLGIIPHFVEVDSYKEFARSAMVSREVKVIDLRDDVNFVIDEILSCELILSSSLHGLIVPMSYGIPAHRWVFSDKIYGDGIKYRDYFKSVGVEPYDPIVFEPDNFDLSIIIKKIRNSNYVTLIQNDLALMQDKLLSVNPF